MHGDDIIMKGYEEDVRQLYAKLANKYELNMQIIGAAAHLNKSMKMLNRTIT